MRRLFSDANYDFIGMRKRAYMSSGTAILLSVVFALFWHAKTGSWLKYGVDFTGGTLMQVEVHKPTSEGELRRMVADLFPEGGTEVVRSGDQFLVRTPSAAEAPAGPANAAGQTNVVAVQNNADKVRGALTAKFGPEDIKADTLSNPRKAAVPGGYRIVRTDDVGAKIGGELRTKALIAILISFGATLIYLAFRFEWRFGLAAVLATVHDIILTLGVIIIFRLEVSLDAIAAILTVVGYSLNDTVIIFDRIRENLKGKKVADLKAILNQSINETLPRTILTISTTLSTLFALFLLGGDIIRIFATILIVGILLGAYSSIFVASPALAEIEKRWPRPTTTTVRKTTRPGAVRA